MEGKDSKNFYALYVNVDIQYFARFRADAMRHNPDAHYADVVVHVTVGDTSVAIREMSLGEFCHRMGVEGDVSQHLAGCHCLIELRRALDWSGSKEYIQQRKAMPVVDASGAIVGFGEWGEWEFLPRVQLDMNFQEIPADADDATTVGG